MNRMIYAMMTFLILTACQTRSADAPGEAAAEPGEIIAGKADSLEQIVEPAEPTPAQDSKWVFIKDESAYAAQFLSEFEKSGIKNVSLMDSFLIFDKSDTVLFPQTPTIGVKTMLSAQQDGLTINLTIERINQTSLDYVIEMVDGENVSYKYEGQAHLSPYFFMGEETDESSLTETAYLATEFSEIQHDCYTYIRLGREEGSGPYLLGKLIKNCNGEIKDIRLDEFPTLVEN